MVLPEQSPQCCLFVCLCVCLYRPWVDLTKDAAVFGHASGWLMFLGLELFLLVIFVLLYPVFQVRDAVSLSAESAQCIHLKHVRGGRKLKHCFKGGRIPEVRTPPLTPTLN